ncbi:MAG: hypothetical protein PVH84_02840 [Candidatus Aminicenantes bacterium]|jgi:hypothetical protein
MKKHSLLFLGLLIVFLISCGSGDSDRSDSAASDISYKPHFAKQVTVFGIRVVATNNVADEKLLHAAVIMAEYLDNDEDGVPDNPKVQDALVGQNTILVMAKDEEELRAIGRGVLPPGAKQSLYDYETRPGGAEQGIFDAALEEIIHPITDVGYAIAYPDVFSTEPGSEVAKIMDEARGGHFEEVPEKYPDDAWYTYYDETCQYDCQVTEYIYWALTSILGAQDFPGRLERIKEEWRYNTAEKVRTGDPKIYALLTDPEYKFPKVLPDGKFKAKTFTIEEYK